MDEIHQALAGKQVQVIVKKDVEQCMEIDGDFVRLHDLTAESSKQVKFREPMDLSLQNCGKERDVV